VFVSPELVERHLGGSWFGSVMKAAVFGIPLPLCSCGVLPVAASLRKHGAGKGATTAFLIATPQTGVDSIVVTYSLLGPVFTVFRPLVALVSGVLGGAVVSLSDDHRNDKDPSAPQCTDVCCSDGAERAGKLRRMFRFAFVTLPRDLAGALLVGILIAGLISAFVPAGSLSEHLGSGPLAIMLAMAVGIPLYVCATASVPIAAAAIVAGVSPGAALAFLMTGPATNAAAVATIWKIMGRRTAMIYLLAVVVTALGAGLLLDYVFATTQITPGAMHAHGASAGHLFFRGASGIVLLGILAAALFSPTLKRLSRRAEMPNVDATGDTITLSVAGMTCSHCVATVRRTLEEQSGVRSARVDLGSGLAVVTGQAIDVAVLCRSVGALGYRCAAAIPNPHE
jgi:uncharacterized membrane protein YraQ (UPF0718 family)/copper chaperone CopZ